MKQKFLQTNAHLICINYTVRPKSITYTEFVDLNMRDSKPTEPFAVRNCVTRITFTNQGKPQNPELKDGNASKLIDILNEIQNEVLEPWNFEELNKYYQD